MNQKIIKVDLLELDTDTDILRFNFEDGSIDVNLNSENCQNSFKQIFAVLLDILINDDISLKLSISKGYPREMYIEVCKEYIKDLNRELNEVKDELRQELSQ